MLHRVAHRRRWATPRRASRFIKSLAKRGYRLLPAVELVTNHGETGGVAPASETAPERQLKNLPVSTSVLTPPEELPRVTRGYVRMSFLLMQVMYLIFYIVALARCPRLRKSCAHAVARPSCVTIAFIRTAAVGIPIRRYLLSAVSFRIQGLRGRFLTTVGSHLILIPLPYRPGRCPSSAAWR